MPDSRNATAPAITAAGDGVSVGRRFTAAGVSPFDAVGWEIRDAVIGDPENPAFEQRGVEFPKTWSQNATNIVAQKYFRGRMDSPERENSVKQMIGRVAGTIAEWGREGGYFASEDDAQAFNDELTHILLHQMAAFNSPVWFNVGFEEHPQCSACFILSVEDTIESILGWNTKEGMIFRGGSGSGINLSRIRGSKEHLSKGGLASGPVSFMRGADAWAGTIKSGGKTRRAAKMVVLDVDHPDILDFIWCKAREEEKAMALRDAGFDMRLDSEAFASIQYQNANNSVRVTDEFMERAERGDSWELKARVDDGANEIVDAKDVLNQLADAAWRCADPGVQYDTTINEWHTCPNSGRINASNPCSEYMHVDDSACNLASLNLMKFRRADGTFDVEAFEHAVDVVILAQEIVVGPSSYPTEDIGINARAFRQLGMGYANLGALLMANGLAYDSDEGRAICAAITALMTGRAYRTSAEVAGALGPYERYEENRDPHNHVMRKHRHAAYEIDDSQVTDSELLAAARRAWDEAVDVGARNGYRNAQATVLAPTGTISFLMDCDTTGIEPDFSLVKFKELVGGGQMTIVNQTVPLALETLGYSPEEIEAIEAHLAETATIVGAPGLRDEHLSVFDVAVGERAIDAMGHVKMMAAAQPFLSGAISKTVNLPESVTVEDIAGVYTEGWKLGLKALAIYRDGSKTAQALKTDGGTKTAEEAEAAAAIEPARPVRRRMPTERQSLTHKFSIGGHEGYITAGEYEDGAVGEIFLTDIGKEGSTIKGMMNAFATAISIGLQYGVPLETFVRKFAYVRFEPEGITRNPEIPFAKSMPDYIMRWLASRWGDADLHEELGILTAEIRARKAAENAVMRGDTAGPPEPADERRADQRWRTVAMATRPRSPQPRRSRTSPRRSRRSCRAWSWARPARMCGGMMQRTGSCYTCSSCGNNTGCGTRPRSRSADADGRGPVDPGEAAGPGAGSGVRAVRRDDAADRLVLHVLELREQHRLRLS